MCIRDSLDVTITATQPRRDASGTSFDAHTLRTRTAEGPTLWAERRYSDFVCLHEEVFPVLALPEAFPVSTAVLRAPGSRTSQLQAYLIALLDKAPPPTLLAFLRPPLYAAVGVAAADCAAALPTAEAAQAVALVRGLSLIHI